jgi:lysophospholipase L1-like esterase
MVVAVAAGLSFEASPRAAEHCPTTRAAAGPSRETIARPSSRDGHWVATWGAAPQAASFKTSTAEAGLKDDTVRELVFTSVGGRWIRVRFTNAFGQRPLTIDAAAVGLARPDGAVASNRRLTFGEEGWVRIPAGAEVLSNPVRLQVPSLADLAVSVFVCRKTGPATIHVVARQLNYAGSGDQVFDPTGRQFTRIPSWYFLAGVDVLASPQIEGAVVAMGDSITDGVGSPVNANGRWPNDLARRLQAQAGATLAVVDEGISGNRVLNPSPCYGPSGVSRFDGDVLTNPDVRVVVLLEGTNDIGMSDSSGRCGDPHTNVSAQQIIAGEEQMIADAHARGVKVFGATILPFRGARYWSPAGEAKREAINYWIRTSGAFDGVIDFSRVVAETDHPEILAPRFDSGDHLHPNAAGYQAMADSIDLSTLLRAASAARSVVMGTRFSHGPVAKLRHK